jgi:hypothetical protein
VKLGKIAQLAVLAAAFISLPLSVHADFKGHHGPGGCSQVRRFPLPAVFFFRPTIPDITPTNWLTITATKST